VLQSVFWAVNMCGLLLAVRIRWRRRVRVHWRAPAGQKTRAQTVSESTRKTRPSSTMKVHSSTSLDISASWRHRHLTVPLSLLLPYEVQPVFLTDRPTSQSAGRHAVMLSTVFMQMMQLDCGDSCWGNRAVCALLTACINVVKDNWLVNCSQRQ